MGKIIGAIVFGLIAIACFVGSYFQFRCQTAHCGRGKSHFIFVGLASPIVPYRNLKQTTDGITADCRSLV